MSLRRGMLRILALRSVFAGKECSLECTVESAAPVPPYRLRADDMVEILAHTRRVGWNPQSGFHRVFAAWHRASRPDPASVSDSLSAEADAEAIDRPQHHPEGANRVIASPDIVLASPSDAEAIAIISRDEIEHGLGWAWTAARVRQAIRDRATNVVVAREGRRVVGFAILGYDAEYAHLNLLGVSRDRRRQGIATALMAWLEATMRVAGIRAVQVELRLSNHAARACYEALGFEPVNATRGYYLGVETALHMVKELSPGIG